MNAKNSLGDNGTTAVSEQLFFVGFLNMHILIVLMYLAVVLFGAFMLYVYVLEANEHFANAKAHDVWWEAECKEEDRLLAIRQYGEEHERFF